MRFFGNVARVACQRLVAVVVVPPTHPGLIAFFGHRLVAGAVDDSGFVGLVFPCAMITLDLTICYAS